MKKLFRIWPLLFIFLIWFAFSYPYFLKHSVPFPSTFAVNFFGPWSAYHIYDGPIKNNAMPDIITQIYPWRHFTITSWKQGIVPLWNPYSFSGTPQLANYQSAVLSPFNILFFIFSFVDAWSLLILLQPLLAGLFTYLYGRSLSLSRPAGLVSSIGFMFCGFMTTWMDYGTLSYAILFLPLALFAIESFFKTQKSLFLLLFAFTIPCSFFSGHFQISLYFLLFICIYIAYKFFETKNKALSVYVVLAAISGLLIAMSQILPSLEFYNQSLRSELFQKIEAIPLGYLPTLLAPDFFGNPVTRNDWFGHYAEWNGYIGLLPLMLGFYGVFRKKNCFTLFLFILSIIILCLAFATPVLQLLIALHIPVLSTSAASRIIVLFSFIFIILSGFGFDALLSDIKQKKFLFLISWILVFVLLFIFLWTVVTMKWFLPVDKVVIAKQNLRLPTILFGLILVIISFVALFRKFWISQNDEKKIAKIHLVLASCLLLLVAFDMYRFAAKWQPFDPRTYVFPNVAVTNTFIPKAPYERVLGGDGAEVSVYHQWPSVEGYDPLYVKRYGEFVGSLNGKLAESPRSVITFPKNAKFTPRALNILNVGYVLQKNSDNGQPWAFPFSTYPATQFTPVYNDRKYQVFRNNDVLSHAFFAQNYVIQSNPQKILDTLFAPDTHLNSTLVLEQDPHISQGGVTANATITKYTANEITISARTNKDALLFLSEVYYPGWNAYIDGQPASIFRADYTFRSIIVPKGIHTVTFSYKPVSFMLGCWLGLVGIIGTILVSFLPKRKLLQ